MPSEQKQIFFTKSPFYIMQPPVNYSNLFYVIENKESSRADSIVSFVIITKIIKTNFRHS